VKQRRRRTRHAIMVAILGHMYGIATDSVNRLVRNGDINLDDPPERHAENAQIYRSEAEQRKGSKMRRSKPENVNRWRTMEYMMKYMRMTQVEVLSGVESGLIAEERRAIGSVYKLVSEVMADADALAATKAKIDADPVAFLRSLGCGGAA
jgi:hypothetical protein